MNNKLPIYNASHRSYNFVLKKRKKLNNILKQFVDKNGKRIETSIEKKVRELLDSIGVPYKQEKYFQWKGKWKAYDFFVSNNIEYSFLIECDGDYWHNKGKSKIQKKNKKNDKFKDELAKHLGIPLLRFKEKDIKFNINFVKQKILEEIERQKSIKQ